MNPLSSLWIRFRLLFKIHSRIHNQSTYWLWIHFSSREFKMNSLGVSPIYFEVIILFANILWINFLYHEFTMNSPSFSRLHSLFCEYTKNSLFVLWTHYGPITFFANLLSFSLSKVVSRSSRARPSPKSKILLKNFWVWTYVYYIKLHQTARIDSFKTSLTQFWPLMTFYDLIWPQILNFLKHMYIWDIWISIRFDPYWTGLT